MSERPTPETDAACPYCKAMPMGMIAKVRWTCGSYGGPAGRSEQCKERANAWEQRDEALEKAERYRIEANAMMMQRDEARWERNQLKSLNESYAACWDEIKDALNESEQGDKTCDLDRVLKAIRERNEAQEVLRKAIRFVEAYEPHSRGAEEDQNETLSIIRKVLEETK